MTEGFFPNLQFEITIDILSRLPIKTIISCKCVCKSWLRLLDSHEYAKSHLSKSAPGMAVVQSGVESNTYEIFEFEDILGLEHHDLHYTSVTKFVFPHAEVIRGSANGLLLLTGDGPSDQYVCNPITRHYIKLCLRPDSVCSPSQIVAYGFGVTKMTGQYKVVRIVYDYDLETEDSLRVTNSYCEVYTLGARTWRSIPPGALQMYDTFGVFLNGNLHWLVVDPNAPSQISCFDLETELFSTISHPPLQASGGFVGNLSAFLGCLCLCDNSSEDKIVIWLMREYGVEASWTKEYVISKDPELCGAYVLVYPIKVFKDGDILMECEDFALFYYSNKTKNTQKIDMFEAQGGRHSRIDAILHIPSFVSLKRFEMEDVMSF